MKLLNFFHKYFIKEENIFALKFCHDLNLINKINLTAKLLYDDIASTDCDIISADYDIIIHCLKHLSK